MTLLRHELRQGRKSLAVWTACIGLLIAVCILLYPDIKGEMEGMSRLFATMGAFSAAFGMDRLNFGTLTGFYAVECGNILGLGGAFFAALTAAAALSKEEKERTAEFLLSHPVSRGHVLRAKLLAVLAQILILNGVVIALSLLSVRLIGEEPTKLMGQMHLAFLLMQAELAGLCFGVSAFIRGGGAGIGIGVAAVMYFLNIIVNISDKAAFLRYVTPFAYCDGARISQEGSLDGKLVAVGLLLGAAGVAAAHVKFCRKDIR